MAIRFNLAIPGRSRKGVFSGAEPHNQPGASARGFSVRVGCAGRFEQAEEMLCGAILLGFGEWFVFELLVRKLPENRRLAGLATILVT